MSPHRAWLLLLSLISAPALAAPVERAPMTFERAAEVGTCDGCVVIRAHGQIRLETPALFKQFLEEQQLADNDPVLVVLDSPGGSLVGGLNLGQAIRERGFSTHVGSIVAPVSGAVPHGRAICASACAYAFLGGKTRSIAEDGSFGLHQISAGVDRTVSLKRAVELTQDLIARISLYVENMGVSQEVTALATQTRSNSIQWIGREALHKLQVTTSTNPPTKERLNPPDIEDFWTAAR